jgi:hypothetical protein
MHKMGLKVMVYTVDEPATMRRMIENGVDGIISNKPALLGAQFTRFLILGATFCSLFDGFGCVMTTYGLACFDGFDYSQSEAEPAGVQHRAGVATTEHFPAAFFPNRKVTIKKR